MNKALPYVVAGVTWLVTAGGVVWWLAQLDAQVEAHAAWILSNADLGPRLARIETTLEFIAEQVRRGQ